MTRQPLKQASLLWWGALSLAVLIFCAIAPPTVLAQDKTSEQAKPTLRKVTVGVLKSFPPYYLLDEDGEPSGFAVEIMNGVAEQAGLSVTFKVKENWAEIFKALRESDIDIVPNLGITEGRKVFAAFTSPLETLKISIFVRDDTNDVKRLSDLSGRSIGVVALNAAHQILKSRDDIKLQKFNNFTEALFALLAAKVDAFAYPEAVTWKLAREANVDHQIKVIGEPLKEIKRGMAVPKDKTELLAVLDQAVKEFITSPEYQRIYVKWFGKPTPFWTVTRVAVTMGLAMAVILLFMGWWRYYSVVRLNKEVAKSELRFRTLYDDAPVMMHSIDGLGVLVNVNAQWLETLGYESDEVIGRKFSDFLTEASQKYAVENILPEFFKTGSVKNVPYQFLTKNGDVVDVELSATSDRNDAGEIISSRAVLLNETERKQLEKQLLQAQKMEVVGQLTGGVAHDFNNMLGVMIGNVEILENKIGDDEGAKHSLEALKKAVDRAASLTHRLLAFSRQQTLVPVLTNVTDLISGLEDLLQRTLGEMIDLEVVNTLGLWLSKIDQHQFENALINLCLNARDAMPSGGHLTIETANFHLDETYAEQHEEVTPGDYVKVAVSDSGTGMTPEVLEKVFEPFFTTKEVGEGSGLGLSMVHGFVKQSEGHITIYSEEGHGTTIKLYMPRSQEAVAQDDTQDDKPELARGSERILVVEDDESMRNISVSVLQNQGYEVAVAVDGKEAINHLKDGKPFDLLFTDVVLPGGMNGVEIAEEAEKIQPNIKVLFTTGYAENSVVHHGRLEPGETLVNKPYRRAELLEKVRAILDSDPT